MGRACSRAREDRGEHRHTTFQHRWGFDPLSKEAICLQAKTKTGFQDEQIASDVRGVQGRIQRMLEAKNPIPPSNRMLHHQAFTAS